MTRDTLPGEDRMADGIGARTPAERRAATLLARLVDSRGPVPVSALALSVREYSDLDPEEADAAVGADIDRLRGLGLVIDRLRDGETVAYSIADASWQHKPLVLDDEDRRLLSRAAEIAGPPAPGSNVARGLASVAGDTPEQHPGAVAVSLSPRDPSAAARAGSYSRLHRLAGLMAKRRTAAFGYPAADGEMRERHLEIYGLGASQGVWFAVGVEPGGDVTRAFAVAVMRGPVEALTDPGSYEIPEDFDTTAFLALPWRAGPDPVPATVRFDSELAAFMSMYLDGLPLRGLDDGELEADLSVGDLERFVHWVLAYGRHARITSPPEAIDRATRVLEEVAARHA
jgi:predicted DNA-binding transcriptional regulator YafY